MFNLARLFLALATLILAQIPASATTPPFVEPTTWATICDSKQPVGKAIVTGTNCRWLRLDGVWRRYLVYVPKTVPMPAGGWPLVFMFHGTGASGEYFWDFSGWKELAEREGAVIVFPTGWRYVVTGLGQKTRWHSYDLASQINLAVRLDGYPAGSPYPARDIIFVKRMLADINKQLKIDASQVFASGFSNGGSFIPKLAFEINSVFAAVSCAGFCNQPGPYKNPAYRTSILYGIGSADADYMAYVNATVAPPITAIPMRWANSEPYLRPFIANHLTIGDLDPNAETAVNGRVLSTVSWATPLAGNNDGTEFKIEILKGVTHEYAVPSNNPNGFAFAKHSWDFFQAHPR